MWFSFSLLNASWVYFITVKLSVCYVLKEVSRFKDNINKEIEGPKQDFFIYIFREYNIKHPQMILLKGSIYLSWEITLVFLDCMLVLQDYESDICFDENNKCTKLATFKGEVV